MRRIQVEVTGTASGQPVPLDQYLTPFQVSLAVEVAAGAISATVEYTFDDVFNPAVTPTWIPHTELTSKTAAADATLISPVTAVRLSNADTGTARLIVLQAGAG